MKNNENTEDYEVDSKLNNEEKNSSQNLTSLEEKDFFKAAREEQKVLDRKPSALEQSLVGKFFKNLCYYLRFTVSPFILALFSALCIYAVMFFNGRILIYIEIGNESLRQSSALMLIIFSLFLGVFAMLLFLSIGLNIKKCIKKRNK